MKILLVDDSRTIRNIQKNVLRTSLRSEAQVRSRVSFAAPWTST